MQSGSKRLCLVNGEQSKCGCVTVRTNKTEVKMIDDYYNALQFAEEKQEINQHILKKSHVPILLDTL